MDFAQHVLNKLLGFVFERQIFIMRCCSFNVLAQQFADDAAGSGGFYDGVNMRGWRDRALHVASLVQKQKFDVCFLQEVEKEWLDVVQELLPDTHVAFATHGAGYWGGEGHGNAILVSRAVAAGEVRVQSLELSADGNTACVARVGRLCLVSLHLECDEDVLAVVSGTSAEAGVRASQLQTLTSYLDDCAHEYDACIVGGDFNAPSHSPELREFFGRFVDVSSCGQRSEFDANEHVYSAEVDIVCVAGSARLLQRQHFARPQRHASLCDKLQFLMDRYASDHIPVAATVEVVGGNACTSCPELMEGAEMQMIHC